jgi:glucan endo-1,3-alpha-glucosidase
MIIKFRGGSWKSSSCNSDIAQRKMTKAMTDKCVFAHFMMGNTYPYTSENFKKDIHDAIATGIDGFALNLGQDEWTATRVKTIYSVAREVPKFKLFFSFDMSIITDAKLIVQYVLQYAHHPNSFRYRDRYFVSTFAGENKAFGHADVNDGWELEVKKPLRNKGIEIYFVPSWTGYDAWDMFGRFPVVDGAFSWAAWYFVLNC